MKVYVDELPKSCVNCDFGYANNFCELDYELDLREFNKNQKHPKCPLLHLAEHDKQVRKQVCDEIRKKGKYTRNKDWFGQYSGNNGYFMIGDNDLDQIQGENNGKN